MRCGKVGKGAKEMSAVSVQQMADRVAELLEQRLKVKGKGLGEKLRRSGRLLPRKVRQAAEELQLSADRAQQPKLLMQLDLEKVAEAYHVCVTHLGGLGADARRKDAIIGFAASLALIVLVVFGLVVTVLVWRGYL